MSNLAEFVKRELTLAGWCDESADPMDALMAKQIMELIEVFSKGGHSGFSASVARGLFNSLSNYEPLTPLTGEDSEWNHIHKDMYSGDYDDLYQNNRCFHVFKEVKNGVEYIYDSEAIIFKEKDGGSFTNGDSRREITFPYRPVKEYVQVE